MNSRSGAVVPAGHVAEGIERHELAKEYAEWMRERWNHPCVVIWDANNETASPETAPAIKQVRGLDLAADRGTTATCRRRNRATVWSRIRTISTTPSFKLANLATANPDPQATRQGPACGDHQRIRLALAQPRRNADDPDGESLPEPAGLKFHHRSATHLYASYTAAETEFWRAHRKAAAVMHFTTLGYSRADGQTSDHWLEGGVEKLAWEPEFYKYVRDAFAPVGLMTGYFKEQAAVGSTVHIPVTVINDLEKCWTGPVTVRLLRGGKPIQELTKDASVEPLGTASVGFQLTFPQTPGPCVIEARLRMPDGQAVSSVRDVKVATLAPTP